MKRRERKKGKQHTANNLCICYDEMMKLFKLYKSKYYLKESK